MTHDTAAALGASRRRPMSLRGPDHRPVLRVRSQLPEDARGRLPALAGCDRASAARCTTGPARRSPTPRSRSGAPTRRHDPARARLASPGRPHLHGLRPLAHDRRGPLRVLDPQPGLGRRRGAVLRRRSCSRAACPTSSTPGSYLPEDEALLAADPLLASLDAARARYAHRDAHARRRPAARHPAAGRERDRLPRVLTGSRAWQGGGPSSRRRTLCEARVGLLSPVTVGHDDAVTDAAILAALVDRRGRPGPGVRRRRRRTGIHRRPGGRDLRGRARNRRGRSGRGIRRRRQPRDPARRPAQGARPRRSPGVGAPRCDEPGHPRLRAHARLAPRGRAHQRVARRGRRRRSARSPQPTATRSLRHGL